MNLNLNDPVVYLKHLLSRIELDLIESPLSKAAFTRNLMLDPLPDNLPQATRVVGCDYYGMAVATEHGPVAFMATRDREGWVFSVASTSAADQAYGLAEYRWGEKHIHHFFNELLDFELPKGTFIANGEMVSFTPFEVQQHHALS